MHDDKWMQAKQWIVAFESNILYNDWHELYSKSFLKVNQNKKKVSANQIAQRGMYKQASERDLFYVLVFARHNLSTILTSSSKKAKSYDEIFKWIIRQCAPNQARAHTIYSMHTHTHTACWSKLQKMMENKTKFSSSLTEKLHKTQSKWETRKKKRKKKKRTQNRNRSWLNSVADYLK